MRPLLNASVIFLSACFLTCSGYGQGIVDVLLPQQGAPMNGESEFQKFLEDPLPSTSIVGTEVQDTESTTIAGNNDQAEGVECHYYSFENPSAVDHHEGANVVPSTYAMDFSNMPCPHSGLYDSAFGESAPVAENVVDLEAAASSSLDPSLTVSVLPPTAAPQGEAYSEEPTVSPALNNNITLPLMPMPHSPAHLSAFHAFHYTEAEEHGLNPMTEGVPQVIFSSQFLQGVLAIGSGSLAGGSSY